MDPLSTFKIEELTHELKERVIPLQQGARLSQQTVFFLNGEVVECSASQSMFAEPADVRTQDYISGGLVECFIVEKCESLSDLI